MRQSESILRPTTLINVPPLAHFLLLLPFTVGFNLTPYQDMGMRSMAEMHTALADGTLRLELRSPAAQREGGVHSLHSFEKRSM